MDPHYQDHLLLKVNNTSEDVDRIWLRVHAEAEEHVYGGGEQFSYFDLRGHDFPIWTREQGVGRNKSTIVTFLADKADGSGGDYHSTYFPQPTFVSSRAYYCHTSATNYMILDFKNADFHEIEVHGIVPDEEANFFFGMGSNIMETVQSLSSYLGRQPSLPDWIHDGMILGVQGGTDMVVSYLRDAQAKGVTVKGLWIQDWSGKIDTSFGQRVFWNWQWNPDRYPELDMVIKELQEEGVHFLAYINPHLNSEGELFKEADNQGYFVKNSTGQTYVSDFGEFYCGTIDFTNPNAWDWYKELMIRNLVEFGFGGWMADFGEYLPSDAVFFSEARGSDMHNLWPALWAQLNREVLEETDMLGELFFYMRAGFTGSQRYSIMTWAGDQNVDWSLDDGVASTIPAALSLAISGYGMNHFDIGGYTTMFVMRRSEALLLRSGEYAVFTPVMRTHEGNRPGDNVQIYTSENILEKFARLCNMFITLKNYTKHLIEINENEGIAVQRPLFYHYSEPEWIFQEKYEYLYGPDLLVAPVYRPRVANWTVRIPPDTWIHLWTQESYEGPDVIEVPSPIGQPPVFYREGSEWTDVFLKVAEFPLVPDVVTTEQPTEATTNGAAIIAGHWFQLTFTLFLFVINLYALCR